MKKIISFLLIMIMILSLTACGDKDSSSDSSAKDSSSVDSAESSSASSESSSKESSAKESSSADRNRANPTADSVVTKRASAYDLETISAKDFVEAMALGWNLGNTLDANGGDGTDPIKQETSWGCPEITQELIQAVAGYGFTTIRIPVTWFKFTDPETYKIDEKMLARVKQVVDWAIEADLFVIINIHHDNYDKSNNTGWINVTDEGYEKTSAQLKAMWEQIGNYFADYDYRLIFEGMNEPRNIGSGSEWTGTKGQWENVNKLGLDFVSTIRGLGGKNAKRFLMVPCYAATSNSSAWAKYQFPENDDRVIMSIHAYTPYNFALNTNGTDQWTSQSEKDKSEIDNLFSDIKSVLIDNGHYAVIGEFGAMSKNANIAAREDWAGYYVKKAKEVNIPVVWWDNNSFSDGETFGIIRRNMNNSLLFTGIVEAMINSWYGTDFKFGS